VVAIAGRWACGSALGRTSTPPLVTSLNRAHLRSPGEGSGAGALAPWPDAGRRASAQRQHTVTKAGLVRVDAMALLLC